MADDSRVVAGRASERTTVTDLLLDVGDDSTLRALGDGEDVANGKRRLLAAVNESTGVEALGGNESLLAELVTVGVAEDDPGKGSTTEKKLNVAILPVLESTNRPESWMISFTMPLMYPLRSAKSRGRNWAGALLRWVCALN